jgi:hypothetical protein
MRQRINGKCTPGFVFWNDHTKPQR